MTPTPNPTAEQVIAGLEDELEYRVRTAVARWKARASAGPTAQSLAVTEEVKAGRKRVRELAGLLSEVAPSEEQIEAAAKSLNESHAPLLGQTPGVDYETWEYEAAKDALTAAGVAPQEPRCEHGIALIDLCQFADHVANDESVPLDPEKVAEVVQDAISEYMRKHSDWNCGELGYPGSMKHFITDALCEAYTEGKLT